MIVEGFPFWLKDREYLVMRIMAACAALVFGASLAHADPIEDCNQVQDRELQLRGCTAYIQLGKGSPENLAIAYLNRANIYAQRTKYNFAFPDYSAALALDPNNPLMPYNRGNAYFDQQECERAIGDFSRAIELDGSFALAYYNRGLAQERLGDNAAAAADYRRAVALDATQIKAQRRLKRLQSQ